MSSAKIFMVLLLVAALGFAASGVDKNATFSKIKKQAEDSDFRYIVEFKHGMNASEMESVLKQHGVSPVSVREDSGTAVIGKFTNPRTDSTGAIFAADAAKEHLYAAKFQASVSDYVENISIDRKVHAFLADSVPMINAPAAWANGTNGSNVKVCVIDTGIDYFSTKLPADFSAKDFTAEDWCIDSPSKTTGGVMKFKVNVSASQSWREFGLWWGYSANRYDISVYYPSGALAKTSAGTPVFSNANGYYTKVNVTTTTRGAYMVVVNYTSIASSVDFPTLFWGSSIMGMPNYWYGCSTPVNPVNSGDTRAFYNNHPHDDNDASHGTHVSGTIAKQSSPKGVAPGVKLYMAKALDSDGSGWDSDIINAISWCVNTVHADIVSMSLGGTDSTDCTDDLANTVTADSNKSLFVIAAGNSGPGSYTIGTPGCAAAALTVGAIDKSGVIADFSSRGPSNAGLNKPDVVAPGVNIVSTIVPDATGSLSGTSMATPHVAGIAALIRQRVGNVTPQQLKQLVILGTNDSIWDADYGYGMVYFDSTAPSTAVGAVDASGTPYTFGSLSGSAYVNVSVSSCSDGRTGCNRTLYCVDSANSCAPNATYSPSVQISSQGTSYFRYKSMDRYNNSENTSSAQVRLDRVAPLVRVLSPSGTFNNDSVSLRYTANDSAASIDSCWYSLDSGANTSLPGCANTTLENLTDAQHTVAVYANDSLGNTGSNSASFKVQTNLSVNVTLRSNESWSRTNSIYVYYTPTTVGLSTVNCSIYNSSGALLFNTRSVTDNATSRFRLRLPSPNSVYTFNVSCAMQNSSGLNGSAGLTVHYDNIRPTINVTSANTYVNTSNTSLGFSVSDNMAPYSSCTVYAGSTYESVNVTNGSAADVGANFSRQGANSARFTCKDLSGNTYATSARIYADWTTPVISVRSLTAYPYINANGTRNMSMTYSIADKNILNETNYSIDGGALNGSLGFSKSGILKVPLAPGNHTLVLDSWDRVLNHAAYARNFTVS